MIKIMPAEDLEKEWFEGRNFSDADKVAQKIIDDVIKNGDEAIKKYTEQFDVSSPKTLLIEENDLKNAAEKMQMENPELYEAICYSRDLAYKFAERQKQCFSNFEMELNTGLFTGQKTIPVEKAGIYVPAGRFALVSTVIMTVTPAVAAGVDEIILCTPPRVHPNDKEKADALNAGISGNPFIGGKPYADENIMATAYICGVKKCYACGGAQSIAAMAYGTKTIQPVDVIVGPGNKFVAAAKKSVFGKVGIDMIAGPTEVFIIADKNANPTWVAADLLAQAEHDITAQPVLATDDEEFANKVLAEIEKQINFLPTAQTARSSIDNFGRIIICKNLEQAAQIANEKAPEHLELALDEGELRDKIENLCRNYGSLFIGHYSAEVLGDYSSGLNHTLPTTKSARYTGGLSVRAFLKTVTTLRATKDSEGLIKSTQAAQILGETEGLTAHAKAAKFRLSQNT